MIGDVSSHGFGAALIMALAMAASGIHAETAESPHEALRRLETSLAEELSETEMFLTLCYAVADPPQGTLTYANAGHPHAFLVSTEGGGVVTRLKPRGRRSAWVMAGPSACCRFSGARPFSACSPMD
jgi:sigma-B regulation protein RsbU (phosphoserine phosphatase)